VPVASRVGCLLDSLLCRGAEDDAFLGVGLAVGQHGLAVGGGAHSLEADNTLGAKQTTKPALVNSTNRLDLQAADYSAHC